LEPLAEYVGGAAKAVGDKCRYAVGKGFDGSEQMTPGAGTVEDDGALVAGGDSELLAEDGELEVGGVEAIDAAEARFAYSGGGVGDEEGLEVFGPVGWEWGEVPGVDTKGGDDGESGVERGDMGDVGPVGRGGGATATAVDTGGEGGGDDGGEMGAEAWVLEVVVEIEHKARV